MSTKLLLRSILPTSRCSRTTSKLLASSASTATKLRITAPTLALLPLIPVDSDLILTALSQQLTTDLDPKLHAPESVVSVKAIKVKTSALNSTSSDQILAASAGLSRTSDLRRPSSSPLRDSSDPLVANSDPKALTGLRLPSSEFLRATMPLTRARPSELEPVTIATSSTDPLTFQSPQVVHLTADQPTQEETTCHGELKTMTEL